MKASKTYKVFVQFADREDSIRNVERVFKVEAEARLFLAGAKCAGCGCSEAWLEVESDE